MKEQVEAAFKKIRPILSGVDIAVDDIKDGVLSIRVFISSCGNPMPKEIVLEIVEEELKDLVPEIRQVVIT